MLNTCSDTAEKLCFTFNCKKSVCIVIGPRWKHTVSDMCLSRESISWCESIRYLGIDVLAGTYTLK